MILHFIVYVSDTKSFEATFTKHDPNDFGDNFNLRDFNARSSFDLMFVISAVLSLA